MIYQSLFPEPASTKMILHLCLTIMVYHSRGRSSERISHSDDDNNNLYRINGRLRVEREIRAAREGDSLGNEQSVPVFSDQRV